MKNNINKLFFCPDAGVEVQVLNNFCKQDQEPQVFLQEGIVCSRFEGAQFKEVLEHAYGDIDL